LNNQTDDLEKAMDAIIKFVDYEKKKEEKKKKRREEARKRRNDSYKNSTYFWGERDAIYRIDENGKKIYCNCFVDPSLVKLPIDEETEDYYDDD
jgi:hypothetical protein